ncbi:MAG: mechanosensitive ion channel family protein [Candidatus Hermodarchaeota archaeon]
MLFQNILDIIFGWIYDNLFNIITVAIAIIIGWIVYIIFKKQIKRLKRQEKLEELTARNLQRIVKILIILIIISMILVQFVEAIGLITSLFTLVGGTILGFAAISTFGNAIAGMIIMTSRPFVVGDYLIYKDKTAKVYEIKLIFTTLIDFNGVKISIPNQKLLSDETENLGKKDVIRRHIKITADYSEDHGKVENALLEAANSIPEVLKDPNPFVSISQFQEFAIEYTLFVFIDDIKSMMKIEADLRLAVLNSVNKYGIDISTPSIVKRIE